MKRNEFIKILGKYGVVFFRNGAKHDIYRQNVTGKKVSVPRHGEIDNILVKKIIDEIQSPMER